MWTPNRRNRRILRNRPHYNILPRILHKVGHKHRELKVIQPVIRHPEEGCLLRQLGKGVDDILVNLGLSLEMRDGDLVFGYSESGRDRAPDGMFGGWGGGGGVIEILALGEVVGFSCYWALCCEGLPEVRYRED